MQDTALLTTNYSLPASPKEALLIKRNEVASLLSVGECIDGVEQAFKLRALGKADPPGILGIHAREGGFHIKAGILPLSKNYFVAKTNANFPGNKKRFGLPTIQGIILVFDADRGELLAIIDSIEITTIRTGAATAVAVKYLSNPGAKTATICGCGNQGKISLRAILEVRPLETVYAYDMDRTLSRQFAEEVNATSLTQVVSVDDLGTAMKRSDIGVTCTPAKKYFLKSADVMAGTFIAAVGADSEEKQEVDPFLIANNKLITDSTDQCAAIGELHHALAANLMSTQSVYAELGEIVAGKKQGRTSDTEIIVFDSTGIALQDVAAAAIVYEKALKMNIGIKIDLSSTYTPR